MGTIDDILDLEGNLSEEELANRLDFAAKDAARPEYGMRDDFTAMRGRLEAAKRYEQLDMKRNAAYSYDRAGKHAGYVGETVIRYQARKKAMELFAAIGNYYDAGFSALHVAEALMAIEEADLIEEGDTPDKFDKLAWEFFDKAHKAPPPTKFLAIYQVNMDEYRASKRLH